MTISNFDVIIWISIIKPRLSPFWKDIILNFDSSLSFTLTKSLSVIKLIKLSTFSFLIVYKRRYNICSVTVFYQFYILSMRRYWFHMKNDFRNFQQIFTFWDPLSNKKRFLRKCQSVWIMGLNYNYLPEWGLQINIRTIFKRMYILCFNFKKHYSTYKLQFFTKNMWDTKKTLRWEIICLNKFYGFFPFWDILK